VFPLAESAAPSGPGSRFSSYRAYMSSHSLPAAASRCPVVDGAAFDPLGAREAWLGSAIRTLLDADEQQTLLKAAAIMNRIAGSTSAQPGPPPHPRSG
jgi:hypothetical protein